MYIPREAIEQTIKFIKENSKSGSKLALHEIAEDEITFVQKLKLKVMGSLLGFLFNESFSDYHSKTELRNVFKKYGFVLEKEIKANGFYYLMKLRGK